MKKIIRTLVIVMLSYCTVHAAGFNFPEEDYFSGTKKILQSLKQPFRNEDKEIDQLVQKITVNNPDYQKRFEGLAKSDNQQDTHIAYKVLDKLLRNDNKWMKDNLHRFIIKQKNLEGSQNQGKLEKVTMGITGKWLINIKIGSLSNNVLADTREIIAKEFLEKLCRDGDENDLQAVLEILPTHCFRGAMSEIENRGNKYTRWAGRCVVGLYKTNPVFYDKVIKITLSYLKTMGEETEEQARLFKFIGGVSDVSEVNDQDREFWKLLRENTDSHN